MQTFIEQQDNGRASTATRQNLAKNNPVFRLIGALDELSAVLGIAETQTPALAEMIARIRRDLESVASEIAGEKKFVDEAAVRQLIETTEAFRSHLGDRVAATAVSGQLDLARTVARRAEAEAVAMSQTGGVTKFMLAWLNRLPDLLDAMSALSKSEPKPKAEPIEGGDGFCEKAAALCEKVRAVARQMGVRAVTAVCDAGGNPVMLQREDDGFIASVDIAMNKAFTAVSLKMTTEALAPLAKPSGPLYGIQFTNGGRIVIFGGGIPLKINGQIIGGFGVSGGTAEQDTALAHEAQRIFDNEW